MSTAIPPIARPLRADAARNRARVLDAARAEFAEHGVDAAMEDIARRAGVGVGTVYRHFETKESLLDALLVAHFRRVVSLARDGGRGFEAVLRDAAAMQAEDRAFAQVVAARPPSESAALAPVFTDLRAEFGALIERAQAAGELRSDFRVDDVGPLMCALGAIATSFGEPAQARLLELVIGGLRAR